MISPSLIPTAMPHGYNASIESFADIRIMSYRYHPIQGQWRTQIMIQECLCDWIEERQVRLPEQYAEMSHEDGRLFWHDFQLHMSLTVAVFPGVPNTSPPCITIYGRLEKNGDFWELRDIVIPKFGGNDWSGQVKNNLFFEYNKKLHQIYQCSPEQIVVCEKSADSPAEVSDEVYRTESPSWEHGEIRGGTQPLNFLGGTRWLRFFHSLHKHGNDRGNWTYAIGALVMQKEPPFKIERISKFPIFSGDERFVPHCQHWKQGVAIPYGAIPDGDGWIVSVGLNDSMCATLKVTEKDLNL